MESSWRPQCHSVTTEQWCEDTLDGSDSSVFVNLLSVCHHMLLHSHSCLVVLEPCQLLHLWLWRGFSVSAQPFPISSYEACVPLLFHYLRCFFTHAHFSERSHTHTHVRWWICGPLQQSFGRCASFTPIFPKFQSSATFQTAPQCTSVSVWLCPAMTCLSLVCFGLAPVERK